MTNYTESGTYKRLAKSTRVITIEGKTYVNKSWIHSAVMEALNQVVNSPDFHSAFDLQPVFKAGRNLFYNIGPGGADVNLVASEIFNKLDKGRKRRGRPKSKKEPKLSDRVTALEAQIEELKAVIASYNAATKPPVILDKQKNAYDPSFIPSQIKSIWR